MPKPAASLCTLADWTPVHGGTARLDREGHLLLGDTPIEDWQMVRISHAVFNGARVRLRITLRPLPRCAAEFYVNHWGGIDICRIAPSGQILFLIPGAEATAEALPDGRLRVDLQFLNRHPTLSLGTSRGPGGRYIGAGEEHFAVEFLDVTAIRPRRPKGETITLVDVGASGGLQREWRMLDHGLRPVLVEPNPEAAAALRPLLAEYPDALVVEAALFDTPGPRTLHVTRHAGCTSLLRPDPAVLGRYGIARAFDVVREITVDCRRYDSLHAAGTAPAPDVIKVDVQGAEYQVLEGFGALLDSVLGVELETHTYPIYRDQKLLHDLIALLARHGLTLRRLEEQRNFDGDAVEFNAWFTRHPDALPQPGRIARRKLEVIEGVWGLDRPRTGAYLADSLA